MQMTTLQSNDPDTRGAAEEMTEQGRAVHEPALALLYAPPTLDGEGLVRAIAQRWPATPVIGCSSAAVMSSDHGSAEDASQIVLLHNTAARAYTQLIRTAASEIHAGVREACRALTVHDPDCTLGLAFAPAAAVSGDAVIEALSAAARYQIPIFGGLADNNLGAGTPRLFYYDGRGSSPAAYDDAIVFALLAPVRMGYGIGVGWRSITQQATVTGADGHVVYRIDGEPAVDWYKRYVLPVRGSFAYHPLAVEAKPGHPHTDWIMRAPVAIDDASAAVTFAGDVPLGSRVSLATVRRDYLVAGVEASVDALTRGRGAHRPDALLTFSCNTRAGVLGTRADCEWQTLQHRLGASVPVAGAYVNGELAPISNADNRRWRSRLYNQTLVTVSLSETRRREDI